MPGTMTKLLFPLASLSVRPRPLDGGPEYETGMNVTGRRFWYPGVSENRTLEEALTGAGGEYWGRRIRMPGTNAVWDREWPGALVPCTPENCPKSKPHPHKEGELVQFASFFAEGGEAYSINGAATSEQKELLWSLFTWFSTLDLTALPLSGQYRRSQLSEEAQQELVTESGWPVTVAEDLFTVLRQYFADDETELGNPVQDLLLPGFASYMSAIDLHLYDEFLLSQRYQNGEYSFDDHYPTFLANLRATYDEITGRYGKIQQLQRWRESLGLPRHPNSKLCQEFSLSEADEAALCPPPSVEVPLQDNSEEGLAIGLGVLGAVLFIVVIVVLLVVRREKRRRHDAARQLKVIGGRVQQEIYKRFGRDQGHYDNLRVRSDQIKLGEVLGKGEFGLVRHGTLTLKGKPPRAVAVKTLRGEATEEQQQAFLFEARLMSLMMEHSSVLEVLAVQDAETPILIATEMMRNGDLLQYLRSLQSVDPAQALTCCFSIASAMAFLQRRKVVHRDLAARNVLVGTDLTDVRLSDFGLSRQLIDRDYYKKVSDDKIPVKWMSLEAIQLVGRLLVRLPSPLTPLSGDAGPCHRRGGSPHPWLQVQGVLARQ